MSPQPVGATYEFSLDAFSTKTGLLCQWRSRHVQLLSVNFLILKYNGLILLSLKTIPSILKLSSAVPGPAVSTCKEEIL